MPPRKKPESAAPPASGTDRISALPDSMLHHVLSFLPAQTAVRTCLLTRRWRHLWRCTTSLRIHGLHDDDERHLRRVVGNLLALRERTRLDAVEIKLGGFVDYDDPYVKLWTRFAVMCDVCALTLHIHGPSHLSLEDMPLVSRHLRTLDLHGLGLHKAFLDFAGCPALERLKMNRCNISVDRISSGSLKHLSITYCRSSLARRVHIDDSIDSVLLGGISSAEHLELISELGKFIFTRDLKHCPTFSKLKTLVLNEYWCEAPDFHPLTCILSNSPVLEKLTLQLFSKGPNHKVEMKGSFSSVERPSAISKHLNIVEVKCNVLEERIHIVLKFMCAFNIRFSFG